jgi:phosphatidate cytidylyltransferase
MLRARLITSVFMIGGFLAALFLLPDLYWAAMMLGIIVLGAWEWARLTRFTHSGQQVFTGAVLLVGICLLPGVWQGALPHQIVFWSILAASFFWLVLAPIWLIRLHCETRKSMLAVAGLLVLLPSWLALVYLRKISPWVVLGLMAAVWIADSAAYFSGKAFGRHKLAPAISPGKTWEGVAGAMAAVTFYGLILCVTFNISLWLVVGFWGLTVLSIVGDLYESLLKRQAGLKDSGNVLPGHGGVLDRIDGLTSTLPLAAFYLHFPLYYMALHE